MRDEILKLALDGPCPLCGTDKDGKTSSIEFANDDFPGERKTLGFFDGTLVVEDIRNDKQFALYEMPYNFCPFCGRKFNEALLRKDALDLAMTALDISEADVAFTGVVPKDNKGCTMDKSPALDWLIERGYAVVVDEHKCKHPPISPEDEPLEYAIIYFSLTMAGMLWVESEGEFTLLDKSLAIPAVSEEARS